MDNHSSNYKNLSFSVYNFVCKYLHVDWGCNSLVEMCLAYIKS